MNRLANYAYGFADLLKFDNWTQLLVNRLFFRGQSLVVYKFKGMEVLIDHDAGEQSGTRDCLLTDMYSRYFHLLPKDRPLNVFDIGANGGGLPLSLLSNGCCMETLACVEMNPCTFSRLHFNIRQNVPAARLHLINAAAHHSDGTLSLALGKGGTNDSIHTVTSAECRDAKIVATRSFDSMADECFGGKEIDLCKIDIEGAEYEVLLSSEADHLQDVRLLIIEIHPHARHSSEELLTALKNRGFEEYCREQDTSDTTSVHVLKNSKPQTVMKS